MGQAMIESSGSRKQRTRQRENIDAHVIAGGEEALLTGSHRRMLRWGIHFGLFLLLTANLAGQTNTSEKSFYDELGQLTTVVYPNGDVITYKYDSIGNILSIGKTTLSSPGALAIFNLIPQQGEVGQQVTIQGQGFSTTPANNVLLFNGLAATVTSATATTLV